ncbi:MAG: GNAT family N-acetyltransferase [Porphyrobacter sp.]|nr:GNAT family N-acetyltransferase [Porphyrobacter sp.]
MVAELNIPGLIIRAATADDCAALERLIRQLGYDAAEDEIAERLAEMQREGRLVLVAELDGRVVGCLSTSVMRVLHRPAPVGRISMLVVDEAVRGRGVGAELVRAAERALAAAGCGIVEVTSHIARTEAHRFYERLGYERTSVRLARDL